MRTIKIRKKKEREQKKKKLECVTSVELEGGGQGPLLNHPP